MLVLMDYWNLIGFLEKSFHSYFFIEDIMFAFDKGTYFNYHMCIWYFNEIC